MDKDHPFLYRNSNPESLVLMWSRKRRRTRVLLGKRSRKIWTSRNNSESTELTHQGSRSFRNARPYRTSHDQHGRQETIPTAPVLGINTAAKVALLVLRLGLQHLHSQQCWWQVDRGVDRDLMRVITVLTKNSVERPYAQACSGGDRIHWWPSSLSCQASCI